MAMNEKAHVSKMVTNADSNAHSGQEGSSDVIRDQSRERDGKIV